MVNFLALVGWNPGTEQEVFSRDALVEAFDLTQVQKSGGVFNEEKLRWMNKEHLKTVPVAELAQAITDRIRMSDRARNMGWNVSTDSVLRITPVVLERMEVYSDIDTMITDGDLDYYFSEPAYDVVLLRWKDEKDLVKTAAHLAFIHDALVGIPDSSWTEERIKTALWPYAEKEGRGNVLWPLRFALSGRDKSPNPFTLAHILGKPAVMRRIGEALKKCADAPTV
jgi:glutamyl/glutaminyl-tRNA synthetase